MKHVRRKNSCDDDYEYAVEMSNRHDRRIADTLSNKCNREHFEVDPPQSWYESQNHHNWSPPDDDDNNVDRPRNFDRSSYERTTYGPPYEKREPRQYDRSDYKNYEKRKYYREYDRSSYNFDSHESQKNNYYDDYDQRLKSRKDYDDIYEGEINKEPPPPPRMHKDSGSSYFYDHEKHSFDRESIESYDSNGRCRKSLESGSLDSREEYRERYISAEKLRSIRKSCKQRSNEEYEQDSDNEVISSRKVVSDTRSLQRLPQGSRPRKSSGSSPWDGEGMPIIFCIKYNLRSNILNIFFIIDLTPTSAQKSWKRPASVSEPDRRLGENRRNLVHTLSGSDGEKDKR